MARHALLYRRKSDFGVEDGISRRGIVKFLEASGRLDASFQCYTSPQLHDVHQREDLDETLMLRKFDPDIIASPNR